jgi:hypothetical protein
MTTLTTLDTLKASHAVDLLAEKTAKERLSEKLDRYIDYVKVTEAERDDLLDAVNLFIQKSQFQCFYTTVSETRQKLISNALQLRILTITVLGLAVG